MKQFHWFVCAALGVAIFCIPGAIAAAQDAPAPAPAAEPEAEPAPVNRGIPRQNLFAQKYHFTLYEVEQYSERLGLSAEQHEIFVALFSAMQERVMEAERPLREAEAEWQAFYNEVFRDEDGEWRQTPDRLAAGVERLTEIGEHAEELEVEWVALQERLGAEMFADLRLLLMPGQVERLDGVHRWRHRARLMRWSELPYVSEYVPGIVRSMGLRPDPSRFEGDGVGALEAIFDESDKELDALLLDRVAIEKEHLGIARGLGGDPDLISLSTADPAELAWMEAVGEQNLKIANMQKKYIRRIANLLEPDEARAFQERCRELAFPTALGRSDAQKQLDAMAGDERLSEEQRERVRQMLASYSSERNAINERWVRMIEDVVAEGEPRVLSSSTPLSLGDTRAARNGDMSFFEIYGARKALDERWAKRVIDLRTEFGLDDDAEQPAG